MKNKIIFAIDAGNTQSGYAIITMPDFELWAFGKIDNADLLEMLELGHYEEECDIFAFEMVASYGMPVGKDVFETCVSIGQFEHAARYSAKHSEFNPKFKYIYRKDEKMTLCNSMKAKDSNIRQALINRYAKHDFKNGKGTKKNPDTFYGVSNDVWAAIAVGVTCYELESEGKHDD